MNLKNFDLKRTSFAFLVLMHAFYSSAQDLRKSIKTSSLTYVYRLTETQASKVFRKGTNVINDAFFTDLADSFPADNNFHSLPVGHYLHVKAKRDQLQIELVPVNNVQIKILNNDRDLEILVHDSAGNIIPDARVRLGCKEIHYNSGIKLYLLKKANKEGLLKVIYQGHTNYFNIEEDIHYSKFRRTTNQYLYHTPVKYVAIPVRMGCMLPVDIVKSFVHLRPVGVVWVIKKPFSDIVRSIQWGPSGFVKTITCWFDKTECSTYKGYIAFNKPKYKQGDTVFVKAYIVDHKNRPVRKTLKIGFYNNDNNKILGELKPYRPGAYKYQFVLNSELALKLDRNYRLYFKHKWREIFSGSFRYEEYELKSTSYEFRSDQANYNYGDHVSLYCKGSDENGLPIPDARVEIYILSSKPSSYYEDHVFIPDTLWKINQKLDPEKETKIAVPDSVFPKVAQNVNVTANFLNSSNEMQTKSISFSTDLDPHRIKFTLIKDTLNIEYFYKGKLMPAKALLSASDVFDDKPVNLPHKERINPFATDYYVDTDSTDDDFEIKDDPGLMITTNRSSDSIWFSLVNPRKLPVNYTIFRKQRPIFRGNETMENFRSKTNTRANYFASVQYIWAGKVHSYNYYIPFQGKKLTVRMYNPPVIYPGQTVHMSVSVTDAKGKPVKGADVTAFSNTKKFVSSSAPQVPYLGKKYPSRVKYNAFHENEDFKQLEGSRKLNWYRWNPLMKLDTIEFYKFLYPKNGYYRSTFQRSNKTFGEFSPFLVDSGILLPVNMIYIDGELVYSDLNSAGQPYVFRLYNGLHSLKIRTRDKIVVVPKIMIQKGEKTIISINPNVSNPDYYIEKRPLNYTYEEITLLSSSMVPIRNNFNYRFALLSQGNRVELLNDFKYKPVYMVAGPFKMYDFNFEQPEYIKTKTEFEPGFEYEFLRDIVKMREQNIRPYKLSFSVPGENFNDSIYTYEDVKRYWEKLVSEQQAKKTVFLNPVSTGPDNGRLMISYTPAKDEQKPKNYLLYSYRNNEYIRVYPGSENLFHNLEPGIYKLFILLMNNSYFKVDSMLVKPNGENYYKIQCSEPFQDNYYIQKLNEVILKESLNFSMDTTSLDMKKINSYSKKSNTIRYTNGTNITGIVRDGQTNEPIVGATILIKGTDTGAVTDVLGRFYMTLPEGRNKVLVSFIGYMQEEISLQNGANVEIFLVPDVQRLDEVIVVGYGTKKMSMTASVVQMENVMKGRLSGVAVSEDSYSSDIRVRGLSSVSNTNILYVVDGIPLPEGKFNLKPDEIESTEIIKDASAVAIYGSRAANGVVIISTRKKEGNALVKSLMENETFMSGVNQSKSLRNKFSDYAYWKPDLITNKKGIASFDVTFPDDITSWKTYALVMGSRSRSGQAEGEIKSFKPVMATLSVPAFLVAGDKSNLIGKTLNYTGDSLHVETFFKVDGVETNRKKAEILSSTIDTLVLNASAADSMNIQYTMSKEDGYTDGELRTIPVFKPGTIENKGVFSVLEKDTTVTYYFDKSIGKVTVHADAGMIDVLLSEINHVRGYKYLCNEQLSSKLKCMIFERRIYSKMNKKYKYDREIRNIIKLIEERKNRDSLWGWWKNGDTHWWISMHAAEALMMAEKDSFKIQSRFNTRVPRIYQFYPQMNPRDKIRAVKLLKEINPVPDYKDLADQIVIPKKDTVARYELMELKQICGLQFNLDSLIREQKKTIFGNIYWGNDFYSLFDDAISSTLIAYRIIKRAGANPEMLPKIRNYFLERRHDMHWRNTWESSRILETIIPDLISSNQLNNIPTLTFSGTDTVTNHYPVQFETTSDRSLTVTKKGSAPVYITLYQQLFNSNPEPVNKDFKVVTYFEKNDTILKAGKSVKLFAKVDVKRSAEYVLIEIPIPAGCSYNEKPQNFINESHREYFKEKTSIFCDHLNQGTYIFEVSLLPRYNGSYHLNPARTELMYFPVFYGREGMKKVEVK